MIIANTYAIPNVYDCFGQKYIIQNIQKMSKDASSDINQSVIRKKVVKSTDLKRRLFEVGLNLSPPANMPSPLLASITTPKRDLLIKHPLTTGSRDYSSQLLKYQPSLSPNMSKTHSRDFQIRKNARLISSPSAKNNQTATYSSFYKPDSVRGQKKELKQTLLGWRQHQKQEQPDRCIQQKEKKESNLDEYVNLVLKGVQHIDEFIYLMRGNEENIYQLQMVGFETVREHEGEGGFQYYTVSRKGFCQYVGGKPQTFLDIAEWAQQKSLYTKIKALKFFHRFRRWKTLQMWRRTITRQRRESIAHSLTQRLFFIEPTTRKTLLQLRRLTIDMEKSVLIIARNQGTYTLQSFKHCQERARRQASLAVQQFSRQSRAVVRKCFESKLSELRESIKKTAGQERSMGVTASGTAQSPKEGAFQALGFPSKMTYEHRSRLRKETGRFLRFSYLVDSLHLTCLAGLYSSQVSAFITRLEQLQLNDPVRQRQSLEEGKDQAEKQKMFVLQLACTFKQIPQRLVYEDNQGIEWTPQRDIRLKGEEQGVKQWVPRICQHWLLLQPTIDEVLDQLGFLLRQGLGSLKCFERWARHREMQKYVSILQQWDDLVSQNWQISQNDNLDPLLLLDSLDPALSRLKTLLKITQTRLLDCLRQLLLSLLNAYWNFSHLPIHKLQNYALLNPADTFEQFLQYTSTQLDKITNELPHRIQLGVFSIQITRIKSILGQKFAGVLQNFKIRFPQLIQERTGRLNEWLNLYGTKLRQQILNIDDYVKTVNTIKIIEGQFNQYREQCNELAQIYQIMQTFRIDTKRRKDFQTVTLKLKDQLDQLLLTAEQNIQRKADLYTREVQKYHLPALLKDIAKTLQHVQQPKFLRLDSNRSHILQDLINLQAREQQLVQQRLKCENYMAALKLQGQALSELDQLSKQINSRVELWQTIQKWDIFTNQYQTQVAKNLQLEQLINEVQDFKKISTNLQTELPPNQVLNFLRDSVNEYHIYLPLLIGFSQALSQNHWSEVYQILPERFNFDLRKRQFTLQVFLKSGVGHAAKEIKMIFEKSRVQAKLQKQYSQLQQKWTNLTAKVRVQGRFSIISNGDSLKQQLNQILFLVAGMLSNPHAQSLKQYSITYDWIFAAQQGLQGWLKAQSKLIQLEKQCRLLDIKKLPDYNFFENAQRLYKQLSKPMQNKGAETGVKLGKLLLPGLEQKLSEMDFNFTKIQENIRTILREHRRVFPSLYLFTDGQVLKLISQPSHSTIQQAAQRLVPALNSLQFQGQRITAMITIDGDRLVKNPISMNSQIEQILYLIVESCSQLHRKSLRNCRFKAIENNLSNLIEQYNIQHLLAVSRVDFSHYTTISIDNQQDAPDALVQFRKVMRKDTSEDIRGRPVGTNSKTVGDQNQNKKQGKNSNCFNMTLLQKYDTLLLQQLLYEQILDSLIKNNISRPDQFAWASQLKFFWEDTLADEPNITVKQMHITLKYGNDFLGSKTKVVMQSEPDVLLGIRMGEGVVYNGSHYSLERMVNSIGYKMIAFSSSQFNSETTLRRFLIGCYFGDFFPLLMVADLLPNRLAQQLPEQKWIEQFKGTGLKRNSPYLKDIQKTQTIFITMRDHKCSFQLFGQSMRIVQYTNPKNQLLKSGMRLMNLFGNERTQLLLRVFEAVHFLQERSKMQGVSLQQFLDVLIMQEQQINQCQAFSQLLAYLKPKVSLDTHQALTKHLQNLGLLPLTSSGKIQNMKITISDIMSCLWQRRVLILNGRGDSKKYFIRKQLEKEKIKITQIYTESLLKQELIEDSFQQTGSKHQHIFVQLLSDPQQKQIVYFEGVTVDLLMALQKLIYLDPKLSKLFFKSNTYFIVDIPSAQKFIDPRALASFPILNLQVPKQFITATTVDWPVKYLSEQKRKSFIKIFTEVILPALQSLCSKDELLLQQKVNNFLMFFESLLPVANILQASMYCLLLIYRGSDEEQSKLEYLVKKQLGDDKLGEDTKITQLIYSKQSVCEGIVSQKINLDHWTLNQTHKINFDYIITPQALHFLIAARRIHDNSSFGACIQGRGNTGKSTILNLYREMYHQNSFYMKITPLSGPIWHKKLSSTLQRHGLSLLGARINYKQTILMIDDLNLAEKNSLIPLQLMLKYKKCRYQGKLMNLQNVKFIITAKSMPQTLLKTALKLYIGFENQNLTNIFTTLLTNSIDSQWDLPVLLIQKMASSTFDLCKRVIGEGQSQMKQSFQAIRRILTSFNCLKIKQGTTPQKQIQKYWAFSILQSLKFYDNHKILDQQLKTLQLSSYNPTLLSFTHLSSRPTDKHIEFLRDPKRLYNLLNERIQKYNQSDAKRYGESFQFLNFDSILQKIVTISHSILMDSDHLLCGRKGTGKESLVRLSAFFNGLIYKEIKESIKYAITEMVQNGIPSPHLMFKRVVTEQDRDFIRQYYFCDFQSQILTQSDPKPKVFVKQKQKTLPTKSTKHNFNTNTDTFTIPKPKLSWQEVTAFKKSFRLVLGCVKLQNIMSIQPEIRASVHIDFIEQVPAFSILQYNQKLLAVDQITCSKDAQILISQIHQFSRQQLGISLRANDDCVRLFSSFLANLIGEMSLQAQRYGKVLQLLSTLRKCCESMSEQVSQLHSKLKQLSVTGETIRQTKAQIQSQLRQKSTSLATGEKLTEILSWLQPSYKERHLSILSHLSNRNHLQMTFAITATYFIYLSNQPYTTRRKLFKTWYSNIPLLKQSQIKEIKSFLSLFLLYQQQFNAEPVDDLPDFYQNMAVIFHSAKPIAIRDQCNRGKQWLVKNCSFLHVHEDYKQFFEIISEYLSKPSNILIEVSHQSTMDVLTDSPIGALLFLPETANTINLRGQQVQVHHEAKVYLLVGHGVVIPRQLQPQFTVVLFSESQQMIQSSIVHEYLSSTQRQLQLSKLDWHRKIRNLKLDCENAIGQVAESIYEQLCGVEAPPEQGVLGQKLSKITDKLMIRAQNQFTKIKEKQQLILDFKEKFDKISNKIIMQPAQEFHSLVCKIQQVLTYMCSSMAIVDKCGYYIPSFSQIFIIIKTSLSKGMVTDRFSLILLVLRQWGAMYNSHHYIIFTIMLLLVYKGRQILQFIEMLNEEGIKNGSLFSLLGRQKRILLNQADIQNELLNIMVEICEEDEYKTIGPFLITRDSPLQPAVWREDEGQITYQKIVKVKSLLSNQQVKHKINSKHFKVLEPTPEESLQSLLKKNMSDEIQILIYGPQNLQQSCKIIKNWGLTDRSTILMQDNSYKIMKKPNEWIVELNNQQTTFMKLIDHYIKKKANELQAVQLQSKQKQENINAMDGTNNSHFQSQTGFISTHTPLHNHSHAQKMVDYSNDRFYKLMDQFVNCIKMQYKAKGLPIPQVKKNELFMLRKLIDNQQNPLTQEQKINCVIRCIGSTIKSTNLPEIDAYILNLFAKLIKLAKLTEDQFFNQAQITLSEGKQYQQADRQNILVMQIELGWLIKTRQLFNLDNSTIIQNYNSSTKAYNQAPKVFRGSKRQQNIKVRRDSQSKRVVSRQSFSVGKKNQQKQLNSTKLPNSQLASLFLLKQTQNYQLILSRIHFDLQRSRQQIQATTQVIPSLSSLSLVQDIMKNQPTPYWKLMLIQNGCGNFPLSLAIRSIISRRNQLFTYHSKFSISQSCELDFKYVSKPTEFMRAYFRSELINDTFFITNTLTVEETQRAEYMRVVGMWGLGWRLSSQGIIQNLGQSKAIQLGSCYIVKKQGISVGVAALDLIISPESPETIMRLYVQSKKIQSGGQTSKLYLRMQN